MLKDKLVERLHEILFEQTEQEQVNHIADEMIQIFTDYVTDRCAKLAVKESVNEQ